MDHQSLEIQNLPDQDTSSPEDRLSRLTGNKSWGHRTITGADVHGEVWENPLKLESTTIILTDFDGTINNNCPDGVIKREFREDVAALLPDEDQVEVLTLLSQIYKLSQSDGHYDPAIELSVLTDFLRDPKKYLKNSSPDALAEHLNNLNHPQAGFAALIENHQSINPELWSIFNRNFVSGCLDNLSFEMADLPETVNWAICSYGDPDYQLYKITFYLEQLAKTGRRLPNQIILVDRGDKADAALTLLQSDSLTKPIAIIDDQNRVITQAIKRGFAGHMANRTKHFSQY